MTVKRETFRNTIKQTAILRAYLKGTSYSEELDKMKQEMMEKLLRINPETEKGQKTIRAAETTQQMKLREIS
jgi:hypothetical protein